MPSPCVTRTVGQDRGRKENSPKPFENTLFSRRQENQILRLAKNLAKPFVLQRFPAYGGLVAEKKPVFSATPPKNLWTPNVFGKDPPGRKKTTWILRLPINFKTLNLKKRHLQKPFENTMFWAPWQKKDRPKSLSIGPATWSLGMLYAFLENPCVRFAMHLL